MIQLGPTKTASAALFVILFAQGCPSPESSGNEDAGLDANVQRDADVVLDATAVDGAITDATTVDAASDASVVDASDLSCPAGMFCVRNPSPGTGVANELLMVYWFQLSDDGPDPTPEIGYSAPFDRSLARTDIPLASVSAPSNLLYVCERACDDESTCPCLSTPHFAMSYVIVVRDENANGTFEEDTDQVSGAAWAYLVYGDADYIPVTGPAAAYIDSVPMGVHAYIPTRDGAFDEPRLAPLGTVFDVNLCPSDQPSCEGEVPNAT